jgi:hypothetical protein
MKLLADKLVELEAVGLIDVATVCRTLRKTRWSRAWSSSPPQADAGFGAAMEVRPGPPNRDLAGFVTFWTKPFRQLVERARVA